MHISIPGIKWILLSHSQWKQNPITECTSFLSMPCLDMWGVERCWAQEGMHPWAGFVNPTFFFGTHYLCRDSPSLSVYCRNKSCIYFSFFNLPVLNCHIDKKRNSCLFSKFSGALAKLILLSSFSNKQHAKQQEAPLRDEMLNTQTG